MAGPNCVGCDQGKRWIWKYKNTGHRQTLHHTKEFGHFACNKKDNEIF